MYPDLTVCLYLVEESLDETTLVDIVKPTMRTCLLILETHVGKADILNLYSVLWLCTTAWVSVAGYYPVHYLKFFLKYLYLLFETI